MTKKFSHLLCIAILLCPCAIALAQDDGGGQDTLPYDFDGDGELTINDLDIMTREINFGINQRVTPETVRYNVFADRFLDICDIQEMVHLIGNGTPAPGNPLTLNDCEIGDFDFNGIVEQYDANWFFGCFFFFQSWGPSGWLGFYSHGDLDGDGFIGQADFGRLCDGWDWDENPDGPIIPPSLEGLLTVTRK